MPFVLAQSRRVMICTCGDTEQTAKLLPEALMRLETQS